MAPRNQPRSPRSTQALSNPNENRFHNTRVKRLFLQMSGQSFTQECGFNPTVSACDEIWELEESQVARRDHHSHGCVGQRGVDCTSEGRSEWTRQANSKSLDQKRHAQVHMTLKEKYVLPASDYCPMSPIRHPISLIEPFTRPMKSVIGDNLYNKFLELQCKKNQEKRKGQSIEVTHSGADEAKGYAGIRVVDPLDARYGRPSDSHLE
ncbi:hypothetical protein GOBAR_AA30581 [Gossypium barbadense]|uniref:Uncharacterized protein n=1 Tax=Gossypium barbadense TaxID=3634 RepID=A0A2P5WG87_GOSBA|nr:hypothetical protein GOBAR_AA30581 [Gossypium barbadense]